MAIERINSVIMGVDIVNAFKGIDGELPVPGTEDIVAGFEQVSKDARGFDIPRVLIREWHLPRSVHFKEFGGPWPPHGLQNSWGSEFIKGISVHSKDLIVSKGMVSHGYSGFEGFHLPTARTMDQLLQDMKVKRLFVGGVATEYCVENTVNDGLSLGYEVVVMSDLVRPIDKVAGYEALSRMEQKGAIVVPSSEARKLWIP